MRVVLEQKRISLPTMYLSYIKCSNSYQCCRVGLEKHHVVVDSKPWFGECFLGKKSSNKFERTLQDCCLWVLNSLSKVEM